MGPPRRPIIQTSMSSEGRSELADTLRDVPSLESLESLKEITLWLGTFRERLRVAHQNDRPKLDATVKELEAYYRRRRAELS